MASEIDNDSEINRKLSEIFDEGYYLFNSFDSCNDPVNSTEFQVKIKKCMKLFEDSTKLVSLADMFSTNELYDEIPTNNLKYLLLPFFLGNLSLKLCLSDRMEVIEVAEIYYKDFLNRCEAYGLYKSNRDTTVDIVENTTTNDELTDLMNMARQRNRKMEQYRQKKELDDQIKQIKILMERDYVDESVKRDFYVKLLNSSVLETQDELKSIVDERKIVEYRNKMRQENPDFDAGVQLAKKKNQTTTPLKPIIITKDAVQKAIYGIGYPSFPTMSVDEFYEDRVREGIFPDPSVVRDPNSLQSRAMRGDTTELDEQDEIKKEQDIEKDDEEYLARQRAMDEFKDDVRRGDGNRQNRS